jgi:uncharacterized protein (UPF0262 family)
LSNNEIGGYFDVHFPGTRYTPEGTKAIAEAIRVSPFITSIDLSENDLGSGAAKGLAQAIAVNTSITSVGKDGLNLKDNYFGAEGWGAIFAAICSSQVSKITSIDASGEGIGPEGAKLIGQALGNSVNASLTSVRYAIDIDSLNGSFGVEQYICVPCHLVGQLEQQRNRRIL